LHELTFITELVEEKLVKGNLRWLANFNEIQRDYAVEDVIFPIYASGSLQEKGFFLSRIFSALVVPKYKIHFLFYTSQEMNPSFLKKIILACKRKFGSDDWIFISLVQNQPLAKPLRDAITNVDEKTVGISANSLAQRETVTSNNVLGRNLAKQLKLTEAKFEAFDVPNYLKSFTVTLALGIFLLILIALSGARQAISPLTLLILAVFSLIIGHVIYKARYHTALTINSRGFQLKQGKTVKEGKWSDYTSLSLFITSGHETCLRLHAKKETLDLPLSRVGMPRKETYNIIGQLLKKR
jgi:hypothetical protein